jgi:hypothetical protein
MDGHLASGTRVDGALRAGLQALAFAVECSVCAAARRRYNIVVKMCTSNSRGQLLKVEVPSDEVPYTISPPDHQALGQTVSRVSRGLQTRLPSP